MDAKHAFSQQVELEIPASCMINSRYYILILRPFSTHATQLTPKLYNIKTPIDNHADAYIVSMLTFTSPVSRLAAKNTRRPFLFIASSKGGTKVDDDGNVWEEMGDGMMWVRRR